MKVSTEQESILSLSHQSTSNQSEKRCFSDFTEEISHKESLHLKTLQCQFSDTDMTNSLNQNDLQQLIQVTVYKTVTAVLTTHNQSLNLFNSSDSQESQELSEQNGNDAEEDNHHEFQSRNIRFLNLNFKLDLIEVKNDKQLYHNIFSFTNQI